MTDAGHASAAKNPAHDSDGTAAPAESPAGSGISQTLVPAIEPTPSAAEPVGTASPERQTDFGMSRGDTWFALVVGGAILVLMLVHWALSIWRGEPRVEIDRQQAGAYEFQLDINRATWVEWMQLEDIGETLARRIVADRVANGPFRSIDDLNRVSGIGPKTLEAIRPHLRCPDCPTTTETPQ
jgi:competence protein ComEA